MILDFAQLRLLLAVAIKTHQDPSPLSRADILSFAYRERPKYVALSWSMQRDGRRAGRTFRELITALDANSEKFATRDELEGWCWEAVWRRSHNLMARRALRAPHLPAELMEVLDAELRDRDSAILEDQSEALRLCVGRLSEKAKWIVQLIYIEGKSGLNAARLLNENPVVLYRDLQKIYLSLSRCLQKRVAMGNSASAPSITTDEAFDRLVIRYLDNQITEAGVQQLRRRLAHDSAAVRHFNDIRLYSALLRDLDSLLGIGELSTTLAARSQPERRRRMLTGAFSFLAATAIVAATILVFSLVKVGPPETTVATFLRGAEAQFSGPEPPAVGDRLAAKTYRLTRGTILLRFGQGAEVYVEAPARFTIRSAQKMTLHRGKTVAMVPPSAVGFTIDTVDASIRDLGTEFGVTARPDVNTDVLVFEGAVEVTTESGGSPQRLIVDEGLRISKAQGQTTPLSAPKEAAYYPRNVPFSEPRVSADNLLHNWSFENGPLSRAPHTGHHFRDVPSAWRAGQIKKVKTKSRWGDQISDTAVGTAVAPSSDSPQATVPHGARCLYIDRAAVRQPLGILQPGSRYRLEVSVATPGTDQRTGPAHGSGRSGKATFEVGLMTSRGDWIVSERETLSTAGFREFQFEFSVPTKFPNQDRPAMFALRTEQGIFYFDRARLTKLLASSE